MRLCGQDMLTIQVNSYKKIQDSSFSSQFEEDSRKIIKHTKTYLPTRSSVIQTESNELQFCSKLQKHEGQNQLFQLITQSLQDRELRLRKVTRETRYFYKVLLEDQTQEINIGDVLKMGHFEMLVRDIFTGKPSKGTVEIGSRECFTPNGSISSVESSSKKKCRICFDTLETKDDPLLCLCRCSGTVKYTHFSCMKTWYNKFLDKEQSESCSYYRFSQGRCDVCRQELPLHFEINGKKVSLATFAEPQEPFVALELIDTGEQSFQIEIVVLKLDKKQISIGTSEDADLCFIDRTIDNIHCFIFMENSKLYVRDNNSSEGTCVRIRQQHSFSGKNGIKLQFENMTLQIKKQPTFCNWLCTDQQYTLYYDEVKSKRSSEESVRMIR